MRQRVQETVLCHQARPAFSPCRKQPLVNEGRLSANLPPWPSNTPKMAASGALP